MTDISKLEDLDPVETQEWLESIDSVLKFRVRERAHFLLERRTDYPRRGGASLPFKPNTAYVNSIPTGRQPEYPGNRALERRIEAYIRWNALAMVLQANKKSSEYGGHLSSYASSATLYEGGFNHVWRAPSEQHPWDMVFVQGHSSPGIYARAFLEGRLEEERLRHFRQEAGGPGVGLSSYPHPWLMPDFWQFPTVSMGLGPMMAIFQARFTRYLEHRGLVKPSDQKVWAFLGDGEMDEPESMGALTMPVREGLDNLIFVINCNLQRLDGPVRGNGKIIQELEAAFLGAGWNVIKVLWGSRWDPLLARDHQGLLRRVMEECVDGEYQNFKVKVDAYTREHFFGKYPELKAMVANMSDEEIWRLNRGGHDPRKVYAAYAAAMSHKGQPTVILAKTVKGFGLGKGGEGQMVAHQQKKLSTDDLRAFRDRFNIPVSDEDLASLPFRKPDAGAEEARYLHQRRAALGGYLPSRRCSAPALVIPPLEAFASLLEGTGERETSTDRKSTRLNSSHSQISYAVFCLKKKKMQNETQKEIAGIQSATSRQNTKDQVYAQNEMLAYQQKESTARVASIMENTNLSKQQQVSEIMRKMLTQAQTAGQYFTNDQIKEMTRKVSAEVDLVHQQTQNQRYGSSLFFFTETAISNVFTFPPPGVLHI